MNTRVTGLKWEKVSVGQWESYPYNIIFALCAGYGCYYGRYADYLGTFESLSEAIECCEVHNG